MAEPDGGGRPEAASTDATTGGEADASTGAQTAGQIFAQPSRQPSSPADEVLLPLTAERPARTGRPPRPAWRRRASGRHPVTTVPEPNRSERASGSTESDVLAVLRIPEFRRLWAALALSSLGDWMGLLATTALATSLQSSFSGQAFALGSLLIVRLLPALIFGPLAGAIADKLDRRLTMVIADVIRCGLFVSIPVVGTLQWLLIASFMVECVSLLWIPAKEASVPHLVPREKLATANTVSLITTYGSAPIGAAIFASMVSVSEALGSGLAFFRDSSLDIVLYFNGLTFLVSAAVIFGLRTIGRAERTEHSAEPGFWASITEGWKFAGKDKLVRGLVVGILGGFAGAGCVIALGRLYVQILGGGNSAYGVLFGAVFVGLATGFAIGPKLLGDYSRTRLFGLAVTGAGITLIFVSIIPNLVLACILVLAVGAFAGVAWVTGYTLLQAEVADELRGRTFALVQSLVRIDLLLVLAAAPAIVGLIGSHEIHLWGDINVRADGVTVVLFAGGLLAVSVGLFAYRQMDERAGVAVLPELWNALRGKRTRPARPRHAGLFVAIEGGEGAGKSTQVDLLVSWLSTTGREVVVTRESGGTPIGAGLRQLLLDPTVRLHARTEVLLNAADRAEHVARVVEPALARGAIVVSDCYVDSSIAYQGAGRRLGTDELTVISQWATHALLPDVTILLDLPVEIALLRTLNAGLEDGELNDLGLDDVELETMGLKNLSLDNVSLKEVSLDDNVGLMEVGPEGAGPDGGLGDAGPTDAERTDAGRTDAGHGAATSNSNGTVHTPNGQGGQPVTAGAVSERPMTPVSSVTPASSVTPPNTSGRPDPTGPSRPQASDEPSPPADTSVARNATGKMIFSGAIAVDTDSLAFHERVRDGFRSLADAEPERYVTLDASLPPEALHARIRGVVADRLPTDASLLVTL